MAGLYVHIPFCRSKCIYCDFYSTPRTALIEPVLKGIEDEFVRRRSEIAGPFTTLYIGGGTPSLIPPRRLDALIRSFGLDGISELTIEANPDDVTPEAVRSWVASGVNRVSMGIQSFDDGQLACLHRRHTAADALRAVDTLRTNGITNISCDLIYGLPGQSVGSWQSSLSRLLDLKLPHLSAYCLTYEPGTVLHVRASKGEIRPTDDDTLADMYALLCDATASAGYEHYEISNFALPGFRSRHNSSYWQQTPYLGLGPGAHSFDGSLRRYNRPDIKVYLAATPAETDPETDDQRFNDIIITVLRTSDGLDLASLTPYDRTDLLAAAAPHLRSGDLVLHDDRLTMTEAAWFRSDTILLDLIK